MSDGEIKQSTPRNRDVKDFAVLLPLFGTSLAIAWEVGRFTPTGGFNLFGLADHIVAATTALPIALAMGAYFFLMFFLTAATSEKLLSPESRKPALIALSLVLPFAVLLFWGRGLNWKTIEGSDMVVLGVLALLVINHLWFRYELTAPIGIGFFFIVAILMSLTLSSELVKTEMARADAGQGVATITTKAATFKARVLMAGDRGLLTYRPDTKQVLFQRADELVTLEVKP
jgi:hypothetical protein